LTTILGSTRRKARRRWRGSSVFEPWRAIEARRRLTRPDPLDENRYSEWQLLGGGEGEDSASLARVLSLLTTTAPTHDGGGGGATAKRRLLHFLFNDGPKTRIVWLSRTRFLRCEGPNSPVHGRFWSFYDRERHLLPPLCASARAAARVAATSVAPAAAYRNYAIYLGCVPGVPAPTEADRWPAALMSLLYRAPGAASFQCTLDPGLDLACLEAAVVIEPPRGGTTKLDFHGSSAVTAEAARVIAHRTHRETALCVDVEVWGERGVAVVAEALSANRCPKHLDVDGTDEDGFQPLGRALRATAAVDVLEVDFPPYVEEWPDPESGPALLLEAIGGNVGLRRLVVPSGRDVEVFLVIPLWKAFWSAALASRTLRSVDASRMTETYPFPLGFRQELTGHVVSLLRTNRVMTHLLYDRDSPDSFDGAIMEAEAVPILQLNRLWRAAADAHCSLASFLTSDLIRRHPALFRRHPMIRYHLLRSNVDALVIQFVKSTSSSAEVPGDDRRRNPRSDPAS
jgi:hypothetical protein